MKPSKKLRHEMKLHRVFFLATLPGSILFPVAFAAPIFDDVPLWAKCAFGALCLVLLYAWWRQCLSPDKTTFTPRIWK
ncbi:hypothetical protein Q4S45_03285 [Massilia sp. R2A-15]|uniref:hypothetical protein n=1 Tax=Massilia sp. R2A-15 TaxID=3064278 RepID=UPI002735502D|nr:hypothetical protein [Massilia sp. R2A-15]WLI90161.1 hypothetical protein Q4S45_03285 [Massilia sp. R2A-15]